jgi:hypothetical protein
MRLVVIRFDRRTRRLTVRIRRAKVCFDDSRIAISPLSIDESHTFCGGEVDDSIGSTIRKCRCLRMSRYRDYSG